MATSRKAKRVGPMTLEAVRIGRIEGPWRGGGVERRGRGGPQTGAARADHKLTAIENETVLVKHFQALLHAVNTMQLERYVKRDFSDVSEKYIKA
ncbi:hypothetical protein D187_007245 [Cystobacter fuscus DSM 2262]|uniref:Uncharacterized protein n=1 Tax=Cystobacter fuscus (strain ATCC 25194 / DSM 2262 / NBRC 100088 / M29) TaxID=1242864 RepID=S9NX64_CYSF2|nr:hypothetical protein [Cystobacter fuscus]EPX56810.1 hypothetical protein D187_007245 [Cystobacter fuscus DSM 2262]